jgi:aldehyde:ferredoxin oxidoreductase
MVRPQQFRWTLHGQLKFAGWDGIVVEGASEEPVWINIVNDKVTIESAAGIWSMDT